MAGSGFSTPSLPEMTMKAKNGATSISISMPSSQASKFETMPRVRPAARQAVRVGMTSGNRRYDS